MRKLMEEIKNNVNSNLKCCFFLNDVIKGDINYHKQTPEQIYNQNTKKGE